MEHTQPQEVIYYDNLETFLDNLRPGAQESGITINPGLEWRNGDYSPELAQILDYADQNSIEFGISEEQNGSLKCITRCSASLSKPYPIHTHPDGKLMPIANMLPSSPDINTAVTPGTEFIILHTKGTTVFHVELGQKSVKLFEEIDGIPGTNIYDILRVCSEYSFSDVLTILKRYGVDITHVPTQDAQPLPNNSMYDWSSILRQNNINELPKEVQQHIYKIYRPSVEDILQASATLQKFLDAEELPDILMYTITYDLRAHHNDLNRREWLQDIAKKRVQAYLVGINTSPDFDNWIRTLRQSGNNQGDDSLHAMISISGYLSLLSEKPLLDDFITSDKFSELNGILKSYSMELTLGGVKDLDFLGTFDPILGNLKTAIAALSRRFAEATLK